MKYLIKINLTFLCTFSVWLKEAHLKLRVWLPFPLGSAVPDYTCAALEASFP